MKITKEILTDLSMCYAINTIDIQERSYCIAASEECQGQIVLIDIETKEKIFVEGLAGGVMNMVPIPEEDGVFLAIQRFYPIFQSEEAQLVKVTIRLTGEAVIQANVQVVLDLPYLHRISLVGQPGIRKAIAASLCATKAFQDDWSSPGSVYLVDLPNGTAEAEPPRLLLDGIHQNHGLYVMTNGPKKSIFITGAEGVFEINLDDDNQETVTQLLTSGVSDVCLFDVDDDGQEEMITISPFHGNRLCIYKKYNKEWISIVEHPLNFGHAIWCGKIGDVTHIVACSRGGQRETELLEVIPTINGRLLLKPV